MSNPPLSNLSWILVPATRCVAFIHTIVSATKGGIQPKVPWRLFLESLFGVGSESEVDIW